MKIKSLESVDYKNILDTFNQAFSDYFVPLQLSQEQLKAKVIIDKIDLKLSVGIFENQRLVAFILHGSDTLDGQKVAYNAATGVVPEKRGYGLTKQMYIFGLPILEKNGIEKILLEVITQNIQAIKSYKDTGFEASRELACFRGYVNPAKNNKDIEIKTLTVYQWKVMETFWDISPTWQNSKNVLSKSQTTDVSFAAYLESQLVGYLIYTPKHKRIRQIAIHKNFRRQAIASTLLYSLVKKYGKDCSIINIDKKADNITSFCTSVGLGKYIEQLEMELKLN